MANTNTNRPGSMDVIYENRTNTDRYGKIIEYNDKFKTLILELSDGTTTGMTWSTFRGAWRKKAIAVEETVEETVEKVVEEKLVPMPGAEKLKELKKEVSKPVKKQRGAQLEYDGRSQNICAWAKEFGMSANTLYNWIYYKKMSVEEAFEKALAKKGGEQ